jgi:hypothetical protein
MNGMQGSDLPLPNASCWLFEVVNTLERPAEPTVLKKPTMPTTGVKRCSHTLRADMNTIALESTTSELTNHPSDRFHCTPLKVGKKKKDGMS